MVETRVSLPEPVADRWTERLDWYLDDPVAYDLSPEDLAIYQTLKDAPRQYLKTKTVFTLPYHGPDHPLTEAVSNSLQMATFDTFELGGDISSSHESKLQAMRQRWVLEGTFSMAAAKPRPKLGDDVLKNREAFETKAREYVDHAIELLMRPESPHRVSAAFRKEFILKTSWAKSRRLSYGGLLDYKPYISLVLKRFELDNNGQRPANDRYIEYPSIQASPVIGTCEGSLEIVLATLIAHEVSHAAQHTSLHGAATRRRLTVKDMGMAPGVLDKPHGQGWQEIYRYLRTQWVNQMTGYQRYVHS